MDTIVSGTNGQHELIDHDIKRISVMSEGGYINNNIVFITINI